MSTQDICSYHDCPNQINHENVIVDNKLFYKFLAQKYCKLHYQELEKYNINLSEDLYNNNCFLCPKI